LVAAFELTPGLWIQERVEILPLIVLLRVLLHEYLFGFLLPVFIFDCVSPAIAARTQLFEAMLCVLRGVGEMIPPDFRLSCSHGLIKIAGYLKNKFRSVRGVTSLIHRCFRVVRFSIRAKIDRGAWSTGRSSRQKRTEGIGRGTLKREFCYLIPVLWEERRFGCSDQFVQVAVSVELCIIPDYRALARLIGVLVFSLRSSSTSLRLGRNCEAPTNDPGQHFMATVEWKEQIVSRFCGSRGVRHRGNGSRSVTLHF